MKLQSCRTCSFQSHDYVLIRIRPFEIYIFSTKFSPFWLTSNIPITTHTTKNNNTANSNTTKLNKQMCFTNLPYPTKTVYSAVLLILYFKSKFGYLA